MLIGILSDTHLPYLTKEFIALVENHFSDCQSIVHAGDFTSPELYYYLNEISSGDLIAVCGNMDPPELRKVLPEKRVFPVAGLKIGVIHGWGAPYDLEERIEEAFSAEHLDCIIYGHSHTAANHIRKNILFFNPGSPTDKYHSKVNSVGYLRIVDQKISGEIVPVNPLERRSKHGNF